MPKPPSIVITIIVQNGQLQYATGSTDAWSTHLKRPRYGGPSTVEWTCDSPFAIAFGERSPFGAFNKTAAGGATVTATVRDDALGGAYKYSVVVFPGGQPIVDDPEICID